MKWKLVTLIILLLVFLPAAAYILLNPEKNELNQATRQRLGGSYIKLSHGTTHFKLEGPAHGKTVVLVHGATIPLWTWDDLASDLVSAGYRVLSYDMYVRGYSDRSEVVYDEALYRGQLSDLTDTLNVKKPFNLIGLSMGGGVAGESTAESSEHPASDAASADSTDSITSDRIRARENPPTSLITPPFAYSVRSHL